MALQSNNLAMAALGVRDDRPPNALQPPLLDGMHLRWAFARDLGFPWHGFYLFRRLHRPGTPQCLSEVTGELAKGGWGSTGLDTPQGQLTSDQNLLLTDDFPPAAAVEFDLAARTYLRFNFPASSPARRAEVRVGFRPRPGDPPPTRSCLRFWDQKQGPGPNPRPEAGAVFEARNQAGQRMPNTRVRQMEGDGGMVTGLDCGFGLVITLAAPATYVEATITHFVKPATLKAFKRDGSIAGTATMQNQRGRQPETLRVFGSEITTVVIDAQQNETLLNEFCFGTGPITEIVVTGVSGSTPVARKTVKGIAGQITSAAVEADALTAIELGSGPAALVELCSVPLSQDATVGWETLGDFDYPMRLPVTHPDYPCTPGLPEDLDRARKLAGKRIQYGDGKAFTASPQAGVGPGMVSVVTGSPVVVGTETHWTAELIGSSIQVKDDRTAYSVMAVVSPDKLALDRAYAAASRSGVGYTISTDRFGQLYSDMVAMLVGGPASGSMADRTVPEPAAKIGTVGLTNGSPAVVGLGTAWGPELAGLELHVAGDVGAYLIQSVEGPTALTLRTAYRGSTGNGLTYTIIVRSHSDASGAIVPSASARHPLDTVLFGSIHPAIAEIAGLAWVDRKADPSAAYDYLIVADRTNVAGSDPARMLAFVEQDRFATLDGHIVHNCRVETAPPLPPPTGLRVYALPGGMRPAVLGATDTRNSVGLRWDVDGAGSGVLVPTAPVLFHVWRASLGNAASPATPGGYDALWPDRPVLAILPKPPESPPSGWPPFGLNAVNPALADGWYGYQLSGIDIFGRHSANSAAGPWQQWAPPPEPRPWYYQDPPGDRVIHPSAVQLRVTLAPPSPTGIEAYALDPSDPTVVRDAAFTTWWNALTASGWYRALTPDQRRNLIGLRVRWLWTAAMSQQAPSTREFRIYFQPGQFNVVPGRVVAVSAASELETDVQTTIAHSYPEAGLKGAAVTIEGDAFPIVGSQPGSPLTVRVRNLGLDRTIRPSAGADCAVTVPRLTTRGRATVTYGSPTVVGTGTEWHSALAGMGFAMTGEEDTGSYTVASVASPTRLTLNRPYAGEDADGRGYGIVHPFFVDHGRATSWHSRFHVTSYDEAVTVTSDANGQPLRRYEVFLPSPDATEPQGLPLTPSLTTPVVYGQLGVTAADDRPYTADDPKWAGGSWGGRVGNEGRAGPPATVFRVLREPPPSPVLPPYPESLHASAPDFHNRCFATFRWRPAADLHAHVLRALDDTAFQVDWAHRPAPALDPDQLDVFPDGLTDPRWDAAKRAQVAAEIDQLSAFAHDDAGRAQAMAHYAAMSNDALRVLASLPSNAAAFTQLTSEPLDPDDWRTADRRNPDDPTSYVPNPGVRAYLDTLGGDAANRYFYRAAHVDGAHNPSALSISTPPVFLPDLVPPERPHLTSALADTAGVTLQWSSVRAVGLTSYRVYRAITEVQARSLRAMTLVHEESLALSDPSGRPADVSWLDTDVIGGRTYWYRITAVDHHQNESDGSLVRVRAVDAPSPALAISTAAWVPTGAGLAIRVTWMPRPGVTVRLHRRELGTSRWVLGSTWIVGDTGVLDGIGVAGHIAYELRLESASAGGTFVTEGPIYRLPADLP